MNPQPQTSSPRHIRSRNMKFPHLVLSVFLSALMHVVSAGPIVSTVEPSIVIKLVVSTGLPFDMVAPTPASALMARQWEWQPSVPAWSAPVPAWTPQAPAWTPQAPVWTPVAQPSWVPTPVQTVPVMPTQTWAPAPSPSPSPSYTYEETHNDNKNTKTHEYIAATVGGLFGAFGLFGIVMWVYYRCRSSRVKNEGVVRDIEVGEMVNPQNHLQHQSWSSDPASLTQAPTEPRAFVSHTEESLLRGVSPRNAPPMVHWTRGQGMR